MIHRRFGTYLVVHSMRQGRKPPVPKGCDGAPRTAAGAAPAVTYGHAGYSRPRWSGLGHAVQPPQQGPPLSNSTRPGRRRPGATLQHLSREPLDEPVCLRKGTIIATVSPVDDVDCLLVTDDASSPAAAAVAMLDQVDLSGVPDWLLPDVQALIRRHAYTLDGTLGSIDATVHRVEIQPGTKPIRQHPYRAGHHARDMIRDEVNRMLEAKVVRPSTR